MTDAYTKLCLDPKCLRPFYETQNDDIYKEALNNIVSVMSSSQYMTESETNILNCIRCEIRRNRYNIK